MAKTQINIRVSETARALIVRLVEHFSRAQAEGGRSATQAEVVERAVRLLAKREKIFPEKIRKRD